MNKLSHTDVNGEINMVDVGNKYPTERSAISRGKIRLSDISFQLVKENNVKKGDILSVAKIAGIMGAKYTANIIPLCHNISLSKVAVEIEFDDNNQELIVISIAKTVGVTGVEMESLMATSTALLSIYDMIKAVDKNAIITDIELLNKEGGKSGSFNKKHN